MPLVWMCALQNVQKQSDRFRENSLLGIRCIKTK